VLLPLVPANARRALYNKPHRAAHILPHRRPPPCSAGRYLEGPARASSSSSSAGAFRPPWPTDCRKLDCVTLSHQPIATARLWAVAPPFRNTTSGAMKQPAHQGKCTAGNHHHQAAGAVTSRYPQHRLATTGSTHAHSRILSAAGAQHLLCRAGRGQRTHTQQQQQQHLPGPLRASASFDR
jgi:hypothetical protein